MQELTVRVSAQVMEALGIPEQRFQMALAQHPEITNFVPHLEPLSLYRELELSELRQAINFQKVYMENHGQELVDKIKAETEDWDPTSKRMLSVILGMVLGDELFLETGFEDEQIEQARGKHRSIAGKYQMEVRHDLQSAQNVLAPFLRQLDGGANPFAAMAGFDPSMIDPAMMGNLDPAAMENFMNMMGMDPSMLEGMDPSLLGFDPNMMGMMGGMPTGNPFEGQHQAIDPTLMQQINEYSDDPEALQQRMARLMMHQY